MFTTLKESPLFRGLPQQTIDGMLEQATYTIDEYAADAVIARRDTAYSGLMIILKGSARGEIEDGPGKRRVIDNIPTSQLISPAFLFGGYNRLPIDVIANEPCAVMTIHRGALFEMMQDNVVILSNFIDIISNRANYFSRRIYTLSVLMLTEKVAGWLLDKAGSASSLEFDSAVCGADLGVTRNALEQSLAELEKKHCISVQGSRVTIADRRQLEQQASRA